MRSTVLAVVLVMAAVSIAPAAPELTGTKVAEGPSRADQCKPEIVARGLTNPVLLAADDRGKVFAVDTTVTKQRAVRVFAVGNATPVAKLDAEYYGAELVGDRLVFRGSDVLVVVDLATGKQTRVAKKVSSIASRAGSLFAVVIDAAQARVVELLLPKLDEKPIAAIRGHWDGQSHLAAGSSALHAYLYPHADDAGATKSVVESNLVRIALGGGVVAQLGRVHTGTVLGASAKYGYAGSLTRVARIDAGGTVSFAPLHGADGIAADDTAAAWANSERHIVAVWPVAGAPYVACENLGQVVSVALTATHVYYMTAPEDVTKPTGVVGRFAR